MRESGVWARTGNRSSHSLGKKKGEGDGASLAELTGKRAIHGARKLQTRDQMRHIAPRPAHGDMNTSGEKKHRQSRVKGKENERRSALATTSRVKLKECGTCHQPGFDLEFVSFLYHFTTTRTSLRAH